MFKICPFLDAYISVTVRNFEKTYIIKVVENFISFHSLYHMVHQKMHRFRDIHEKPKKGPLGTPHPIAHTPTPRTLSMLITIPLPTSVPIFVRVLFISTSKRSLPGLLRAPQII